MKDSNHFFLGVLLIGGAKELTGKPICLGKFLVELDVVGAAFDDVDVFSWDVYAFTDVAVAPEVKLWETVDFYNRVDYDFCIIFLLGTSGVDTPPPPPWPAAGRKVEPLPLPSCSFLLFKNAIS